MKFYIFAERLDCKVNSCSQYLYKHKILDLIQEMRDRRQEERDMTQETGGVTHEMETGVGCQ